MADVIRVFAGYDKRQPLAFNVLQHSVQRHTVSRVTVEPLMLERMPVDRRGLTEFTFSRFLIPLLCGFEGKAIFMDSDIAVRGDVAELWEIPDGSADVYVMREQERFEWPSVMVFDNARCKVLTEDFVADKENNPIRLEWAVLGDLPSDWNHCVGYAPPREDAKLYHYTQGLPCWYESAGLPEDHFWMEEMKAMTHTVGWGELMGSSVHAKPVLERMLRRYGCNVSLALG